MADRTYEEERRYRNQQPEQGNRNSGWQENEWDRRDEQGSRALGQDYGVGSEPEYSGGRRDYGQGMGRGAQGNWEPGSGAPREGSRRGGYGQTDWGRGSMSGPEGRYPSGRSYGREGSMQGGYGQTDWGGGRYSRQDWSRGSGMGYGQTDWGQGNPNNRGYGQTDYDYQGLDDSGYGQGGYQGSYGSQGYGQDGSNWGQRDQGTGRGYGVTDRGQEYQMNRGPHSGKGPQGYKRSDERIKEDLSEQLTQHGLIDASDITVQVQEGEVTLTGTVNSREAKHMAEDLAEACSGVQQVQNQLRVQKEPGGNGKGESMGESATGRTQRTTSSQSKTH